MKSISVLIIKVTIFDRLLFCWVHFILLNCFKALPASIGNLLRIVKYDTTLDNLFVGHFYRRVFPDALFAANTMQHPPMIIGEHFLGPLSVHQIYWLLMYCSGPICGRCSNSRRSLLCWFLYIICLFVVLKQLISLFLRETWCALIKHEFLFRIFSFNGEHALILLLIHTMLVTLISTHFS